MYLKRDVYMKRIETIKDKKVFNNIIRKGQFVKNDYFVLYYIVNNDNLINKYGIAISNKVGKAVIRNKLKRQIRSIIDNNKNLFKIKGNYIIMVRKACLEASYQALEKALIELL